MILEAEGPMSNDQGPNKSQNPNSTRNVPLGIGYSLGLGHLAFDISAVPGGLLLDEVAQVFQLDGEVNVVDHDFLRNMQYKRRKV